MQMNKRERSVVVTVAEVLIKRHTKPLIEENKELKRKLRELEVKYEATCSELSIVKSKYRSELIHNGDLINALKELKYRG